MKKAWSVQEESFFGIGIYQPKTEHNIGTLWRSARILGAAFIFIIDGKYKPQSSDTEKAWSKIPFYRYKDIDHFYDSLPYASQLVGIEMDENSTAISTFAHPGRAVYLLGAEDNGLPGFVLDKCHHLIQLPGEKSLNVAVSGSIVLFDRIQKREIR